jgi:hypothetical protein
MVERTKLQVKLWTDKCLFILLNTKKRKAFVGAMTILRRISGRIARMYPTVTDPAAAQDYRRVPVLRHQCTAPWSVIHDRDPRTAIIRAVGWQICR